MLLLLRWHAGDELVDSSTLAFLSRCALEAEEAEERKERGRGGAAVGRGGGGAGDGVGTYPSPPAHSGTGGAPLVRPAAQDLRAKFGLEGSRNKSTGKEVAKEVTTCGSKVVPDLRFVSCAKTKVVEKILPNGNLFLPCRVTKCLEAVFGDFFFTIPQP